MNIKLVVVGKTEEDYLNQGIEIYLKRLTRYVSFEIVELPNVRDAKNLSPPLLKDKEADMILKHTSKADRLVLFDEKGTEYGSVEFADYLQMQMNQGIKTLVFVVGGAYGFSEKVYRQAHHKIAVSRMTFSHQMVRLLIVEQIYRAFTILKSEPYHKV